MVTCLEENPKIRIRLLVLFGIILGLWLLALPVSAHKNGEKVKGSWNRVAGTYNEQGQLVMNVCTKDYKKNGKQISVSDVNSDALDVLCEGNEEKTIVIPAGSTVELEDVFQIESNTTIIADGATIVMTESGKGILNNTPTAVNYNSLKNVTIHGGTWKINNTKEACTVMRFCHGSNLTIENATIISNYESHAIELIAMKDVTIKNCSLKVQGKKNKKSVEDALQIDLASPKTAPGLVPYGKQYVKGQTCKNIQVIGNYIEGSRGLCANYAPFDGKKYKNQFHDNITVIGNTMIGYSAEGCVLYNTKNAVVKNNVIKTFSTRKNKSYSVGLNITIQGKTSKKSMKNTKITVKGNKIYGFRQGMQLVTMTSSHYKRCVVTNNKSYASKKQNAIVLYRNAVSSIKSTGNRLLKR